MARRGKSQARRSGRSGGVPAWLWLAGGILVGIVIAAGFMLRDRLGSAFEGPRPNPAATAPTPAEEPVAQKPVEPKKPRYDFYTVLSERETEVGDAELRARAQAEAQTPSTTPESAAEPAGGERYLLQAGAFSEAARAEEVKAAIAFTGLVARVEAATTAEGRTVHRVLLGPYGNARELEAAKQTLAANGLPSVAVRVR